MKKVKKIIIGMMVTTMAMGTMVGCGSKAEKQDGGAPKNGEKINITLLAAGFGDKSFWDSSKSGVEEIGKQFGDKVEVNIVDISSDEKKWPTAIREAGDSDTDIIITGSFQQKENVEEIAQEYPDKKWIVFDTDVDYENNKLDNVYSMGYKANESGFLAGMVAAELTTTDNEGINQDKTIGFIGAMENNPVIQNFLIGYIEGAKFVDKEIKVAVSYVGGFSDSAKAKEMALAQFNSNNVDVIFSVAGAASTGAIEAASNVGKYVIGVDSDQSLLYEGRAEQKSIVTSALKRVDNSLIYTIKRHLDSGIPFGTYEILGVKEGATGIVYNDILSKYIDGDFIKELKDTETKLSEEKIKVPTAEKLGSTGVTELVNSVK